MGPEVLAVAAVAGSVASAGSSLMKGREQARAARMEQQQLEIQAQQAHTAAAQIEAKRRGELESQLGTIANLQAARGVGAGAPTTSAITTAVTGEKLDQMYTERANMWLKGDQARRASLLAGDRADLAPWSGLLEGAGTLLKGASNLKGV